MTLSENPLGCSNMVLKILKTLSINDVSEYPNARILIKQVARVFDRFEDEVVLGSGSEQLIKLVAQTFLKPKDFVLVQTGSFSLFTKECLLKDTLVEQFNPNKNARINPKTKLIIICSPNNPTGEILSEEIIQRILTIAPCPVIIDEANAEFTEITSIPKAITTGNGIVLRTFSKAFGLAGLRVGYAVGPRKLIKKLQLSQQPFPVSTIACKMAMAALRDKMFIKKTIRFFATERNRISKALTKRGFRVSASCTNTLFVETPQKQKVIQNLAVNDVSVVDGSFFPFIKRSGFRIALRDKKTNTNFLRALDKALSCQTNKNLLRSKEIYD